MSWNAWHESRLWLAVGWAMFHFFWLGTLLGMGAAIVRPMLRRIDPRVRYTAALSLLMLAAAIPVGLFLARMGAAADPIAELSIPSTTEIRPAIDELHTASAENADALPAMIEPAFQPRESVAATAGPMPFDWGAVLARGFDELCTLSCQWLPWLWIAGMPLALTVLGCGVAGAERLRGAGRPLEDESLAALFQRLQRALRISQRVAVAVCDRAAVPLLVGIVRPVILLPPAVLAGCTAEQIEMIFLHELAHVRRWDNLVNFIQRLVEAVLFFHPVVWWLSRWVRLERETCCDQVVVDHICQPQAYAETLAALALPGISPRHAAVAMADRHLVGRIRHILNLEEKAMSGSRSGLVALAAFLVCLGCFSAFLIQPASHARAEPAPSLSCARLEENWRFSTANATNSGRFL